MESRGRVGLLFDAIGEGSVGTLCDTGTSAAPLSEAILGAVGVCLSLFIFGFPYHPMSSESEFKRNDGAEIPGRTGVRKRYCFLGGRSRGSRARENESVVRRGWAPEKTKKSRTKVEWSVVVLL